MANKVRNMFDYHMWHVLAHIPPSPYRYFLIGYTFIFSTCRFITLTRQSTMNCLGWYHTG